MTKSGHALEDLIGRLGPDKWLRPLIRDLNVALDGDFQLARAAMGPAPELLVGKQREPALNQPVRDSQAFRAPHTNGVRAPGGYLFFDLLVVGVTAREIGNGLTETPNRCIFSMFSVGLLMNTGADNQGTHYIRVDGNLKVDRDNLVLLPSPTFCPEKIQTG